MADTTLSFNVLAKDNASKTFDNVGKSAGRLGKVTAGLGKVAKTGAVGLGVLAAGAAASGPKVFSLASNIELMGKKSATVFGPQLASVQKWASGSAAAMGLTKNEAVGLAAGFADLLKPMGFTEKQAASMSTKVVNLSGALSQWTGGTKSAAEVSEILSAAMLGERDGLQALGISISQAQVDAQVLANTKKGLKFATEEQAQAQATADLIMAKSTDAQKAYAESSDTLAQKIAKGKAQIKTFGETLLTKALPALTAVAGFATTKAIPKFQEFAAFIGTDLAPKVGKKFGEIRDKVEAIWEKLDLSGVATKFTDAAVAWGRAIAATAKGWAQVIIDNVKTGLDSGNWEPLGRSLGDALLKAIKGAGELVGKITSAVGDLIGKVDWFELGKDVGRQAAPFIVGFLDSFLDGVIDVAKNHTVAFALAVAGVIFAPIRFLKPIITVLRRIPIVGPLIGWLLGGLNKLGGPIGKAMGKVGGWLVEGIRRVFPEFGKAVGLLPIRVAVLAIELAEKATGMMRGLVGGIGGGIKWVVVKIAEVIARLVSPFLKSSGWLVKQGAALLSGLLRGVFTVSKGIGTWVVVNVIRPGVAPFARAGTWLVQRGRDFISGLFSGLSQRWQVVAKWIGGLRASASAWLGNTSRTLYSKGSGFLSGLWSGLIDKWKSVTSWIGGLKASVSAWLGDTGKWLVGKGSAVLGGFLSGMVSKWGEITKWVSGIATWIKNNKGPVSLDAKLLVPAGAAIMSGFLKGLKSGAGPAWDFVKGVGGKSVEMLRSVFGGNEAFIPGDVGVLTGPNRRVFYQGEALDLSTYRKIKQAEAKLGEALNVTQGSYERRSSYSGSTHTGGGVFDVVGGNLHQINSILRGLGFASWVRQPWQGPWPPHVHAIERGNTRASDSAKAQVADFMRGGDGLAGYKQGTPWVPNDQLAFLHKGEAVVPADVNAAARTRGGDGGQFLGTVRFELTLDGKTIQTKLLKLKRTNGGLALGLA